MLFIKKQNTHELDALHLIIKRISDNDMKETVFEEILTIINNDILNTCGISLYSYGDNENLEIISSTYEDETWLGAQKELLNKVRKQEYSYGARQDIGNILLNNYISSKREPAVLNLRMGMYDYGVMICDCKVGDSKRVLDIFEQWKSDDNLLGNMLYHSLVIMIRQTKMLEKISDSSDSNILDRKHLVDVMMRYGYVYLLEISVPDVYGYDAYTRRMIKSELKSVIRDQVGKNSIYELDGDVFAVLFEKSQKGASQKDKCISGMAAYYSKKEYQPGYVECEVVGSHQLLALYVCEDKCRELMPRKLYSFYYDGRQETFLELMNIEEENTDNTDGAAEEETDNTDGSVIVEEKEHTELVNSDEEYSENDYYRDLAGNMPDDEIYYDYNEGTGYAEDNTGSDEEVEVMDEAVEDTEVRESSADETVDTEVSGQENSEEIATETREDNKQENFEPVAENASETKAEVKAEPEKNNGEESNGNRGRRKAYNALL